MQVRLVIFLCTLCLLVTGCDSGSDSGSAEVVLTGEAFASRYHITLRGHVPHQSQVAEGIAELLDEIDRQASTWREDSWVWSFNARPDTQPVAVPEHVWSMLSVADQVHRDSGGTFDVTCGPLVALWGFGPEANPSNQGPSEMQLALALANCGMDQIVLDYPSQTVARRNPGVTIDLSGLAKGYAIDQIAALLDEHGVEQYLIEFGGEVFAKDLRMAGPGWVIAIDNGLDPQRREQVTLHNQAVATSGTSEREHELSDGQRVSHLIDPRTGRALPAPSRSITAVAPTGVLADAWATALAIDHSPANLDAAQRAGVRVTSCHPR